jgi:DNA primase
VCGVGGDVIKFVELFKKVSKTEALKIVGDMIGFDFSKHEELFKNSQFDHSVKYLFDINKICCELYQSFLFDKKNASKLEYLHNRGLDDETIKKFKIGYAPDTKDLIYSILTNKDNMFGTEYDKNRIFNEQQLIDAGIITVSENGTPYDFFSDRITFPIFNNDVQVVGFSGRTVKNAEPKYLNSKENKVFIKSNILYNFYNAINAKSDKLIIVEGYMDAIAFSRAGYDDVVATMGTAMSGEHIKLLQTTEFNTFILAFDNDNAGTQANIANGLKLLENNLSTFVIGSYDKSIKDIDELLSKQKVSGIKKVYEERVDYISFLINVKLSEVKSLDEKINNIKNIFRVMNECDDVLLKTQHLQLISDLTNVNINDLSEQYDSLRNTKQNEMGYIKPAPV